MTEFPDLCGHIFDHPNDAYRIDIAADWLDDHNQSSKADAIRGVLAYGEMHIAGFMTIRLHSERFATRYLAKVACQLWKEQFPEVPFGFWTSGHICPGFRDWIRYLAVVLQEPPWVQEISIVPKIGVRFSTLGMRSVRQYREWQGESDIIAMDLRHDPDDLPF